MRTQLVIALATFAAFISLLNPGHASAQSAVETTAATPVGARHAVPLYAQSQITVPTHFAAIAREAIRPASQSASAPQSQTPAAADDEAAIRHVAELYMSFDPAKLREGFYAQSNLYVAGPQGELRVIPFAQFLENVAKSEVAGRKRPVMQIDMIDHVGTAAVVKITERSEEATVTDYLSLIRSAEGWKVIAKSFYVDRKPHASADTSSPPPGGARHAVPLNAQLQITAPTPQSTAIIPASMPQQPAAQSPSAQSSTPAENLCGAANDVRAFDYMLGDWTTTDSPPPAGGTAFGTSHTENILDGCAILEHRHIEQNGKTLFNADVIWGYDIIKKEMLLFYVDDHAHTQLYEGRRENNGWSFYRDRPDKDGTMITIRINYAQAGSQFTQTVHRSKDHGATWEPTQSVTTYEPKR